MPHVHNKIRKSLPSGNKIAGATVYILRRNISLTESCRPRFSWASGIRTALLFKRLRHGGRNTTASECTIDDKNPGDDGRCE